MREERSAVIQAPFGTYAPTRRQEWLRGTARRLKRDGFGRKAASVLYRLAGGRSGRPFDVTVFETQKARLYPSDNISEKRVFITPQSWEIAERALLGRAIARHPGRDYAFLDVGANAGLYTLFANAQCQHAGKSLHSICVEPQPEMLGRLAFNLGVSGIGECTQIFACAAAAADGRVRFSINARSRGQSRTDSAGPIELEARTLRSIVTEAGVARLDAIKIDIEGGEAAVLDAYLTMEEGALRPGLILAEMTAQTRHELISTLARHGYGLALSTDRNGAFLRGSQS